jgi:hypothetical protein
MIVYVAFEIEAFYIYIVFLFKDNSPHDPDPTSSISTFVSRSGPIHNHVAQNPVAPGTASDAEYGATSESMRLYRSVRLVVSFRDLWLD